MCYFNFSYHIDLNSNLVKYMQYNMGFWEFESASKPLNIMFLLLYVI